MFVVFDGCRHWELWNTENNAFNLRNNTINTSPIGKDYFYHRRTHRWLISENILSVVALNGELSASYAFKAHALMHFGLVFSSPDHSWDARQVLWTRKTAYSLDLLLSYVNISMPIANAVDMQKGNKFFCDWDDCICSMFSLWTFVIFFFVATCVWGASKVQKIICHIFYMKYEISRQCE